MATVINVSSTYSGDAIKKYLLQCLFGGDTLDTTGINIETNIKFKRVIKKFTSQDILQAGTCDFTPAGTFTISEGVLEPQWLQVNEELCFEDLYELWDSADMSAGMNDEDIPASVAEAFVNEIIGQVTMSVEILVWQGETSGVTGTYLDLIDGYENLLDNGTPVSVTAIPITPTNVVDELNKIIAAQPKCIMGKPASSKVIFLSPADATAYQQNLSAQGILTTVQEQPLAFAGIELRPVGGISDGKMVLTLRDNFYAGTDLISDLNDLKVIDQREITGSQFVRMILNGKIDVAIGWTSEVVYYA